CRSSATGRSCTGTDWWTGPNGGRIGSSGSEDASTKPWRGYTVNIGMGKEDAMEYANLAVEELKMLQEIIGRHENHAMRIKGLLFVIIAGLTAAIYTKDIEVSRFWMFFGATGLTLLFLVW